MATQVKYELGERKDFAITSIEDIEKVLKGNNIISTYHEHLKQVNICILMFEELEAGRSCGEMFSDWADGRRSKVIDKDLVDRLRELKEEILTGISYYTRLLAQTDHLKEVLKYVPISRTKLYVKHEKVPEVSSMAKIGTVALYAGAGVVGGGILFGGTVVIDTILAEYGTLLVSIKAFTLVSASTVMSAAGAGAATGAVIMIIYAIAKNQGKKRGLKYQQIIDLKDALEAKYLGNIRSNHELLEKIYDTIDKKFKSDEFKNLVAEHVYSNEKQKSFKELKEEGIDDTMCEKISERDAKKECKSFLTHHFGNSEKEAEKITAIARAKS